ncbi:uncharacterized protein [Anabrus simplex]|uniref:uncharacterized protein n=1 Tax=Anabrus simplex TaxID=316456 RepID=UPI0034DDC859
MAAKLLVVTLIVAVSAIVARARPEEVKKDEQSNVISGTDAVPDASAAPATPDVTVPHIHPLTTGVPSVTGSTVRPSGTGFSRFIDDVFQIPISVLKAVNKLLTNPLRENKASSS